MCSTTSCILHYLEQRSTYLDVFLLYVGELWKQNCSKIVTENQEIHHNNPNGK